MFEADDADELHSTGTRSRHRPDDDSGLDLALGPEQRHDIGGKLAPARLAGDTEYPARAQRSHPDDDVVRPEGQPRT